MYEVHCKNCKKLLFKCNVFDGEVVCGRCKHKAHYSYMSESFIRAVRNDSIAEV